MIIIHELNILQNYIIKRISNKPVSFLYTVLMLTFSFIPKINFNIKNGAISAPL